MLNIKVAAIQYPLKDISDTDAFKKQVSQYVNDAMTQKADFIVFPEFVTLQLASMMHHDSVTAKTTIRKINAYTPFILELFSDLSRSHQVHIISDHPYCQGSNRTVCQSCLPFLSGRAL
ncbi:MAG: hypothetical protein H0Z33_08460 [Bacillaceae bacterium]|nr:hypothetical protein [Bacillaceae bacterium]